MGRYPVLTGLMLLGACALGCNCPDPLHSGCGTSERCPTDNACDLSDYPTSDRGNEPNSKKHSELPPKEIQRTIRARYPVFKRCYEEGLARFRHLQGRLTIHLVIAPDGTVVCAGGKNEVGDIGDCEVERCVLDEVRAISFPAPGIYVKVIYPIRFATPLRGD